MKTKPSILHPFSTTSLRFGVTGLLRSRAGFPLSAFRSPLSGLCFLLILLVLTPQALRAGDGDSIIRNGGFEEWSTPAKFGPGAVKFENEEVPINWAADLYPPTLEVETRPLVAKDRLIKHGGDYSLRMDAVEGAPFSLSPRKDDSAWGPAVVPVEPGKRYVFRGWFRGKDLVPKGAKKPVFAAILYLNDLPGLAASEGKLRNVILPIGNEGTTDWTPFEVEFETSPEEGFLLLTFRISAVDGQIWLDDVEIVPAS